jgi:hypothetical protein
MLPWKDIHHDGAGGGPGVTIALRCTLKYDGDLGQNVPAIVIQARNAELTSGA